MSPDVLAAARDLCDLPPSTVRAELIAARVTEFAGNVSHHLAIASEQAMPRPTIRQRLSEKLRSFVVADAPAAPYDDAGYYPVRRSR